MKKFDFENPEFMKHRREIQDVYKAAYKNYWDKYQWTTALRPLAKKAKHRSISYFWSSYNRLQRVYGFFH
jgi:hypothetical protein